MANRLLRTKKTPLCTVESDEKKGCTTVRLYTRGDRTVMECTMYADGHLAVKFTRDGQAADALRVEGAEGPER